MSVTPRPEYPRPQFRRTDWVNLNGEWSFAFVDEDVGLARGWQGSSAADLEAAESPFDRRINVPFCYQAPLSGIGDASFHDVVWYARALEVPKVSSEECLLLHFGAVDYRRAPASSRSQGPRRPVSHLSSSPTAHVTVGSRSTVRVAGSYPS